MKVCIAEKPSVAREIAHIVGAKDKKDGYFEGNGYAVTWTFGHFCSLYAPDDYDQKWKSWTLDNLPMLPEKFETKLMDDAGVKKQFKVIKALFQKADVVINCGDAGQEGELIQRWVLKEANYKGKVLRLWISSLTAEAIRDGFQNLRDASNYNNLYYAGSSRAIGDWLLGMNATRLYTLRYGAYKQVLSIGRVQTPTLAMLVDRHKEIMNFKPEPFWELQTIYREAVFSYTKGRFTKKEEGEALFQQVEGHPFEITDVSKKNGKELPPKLFDLTSLQVYCNNKFGYSADTTLKIAQSLYEQKVISYPRVDTTFLPNDIYPKVTGILQKLTNYSQYTQTLLGQPIRKSSKVFDDKKVTDHHAIIPTGYQHNLPHNEAVVYDIITRHFIAAFYPDCLVANTTVLGEANKVPFKATGKEILEMGWRVLFQNAQQTQNIQKTEDKEKEEEEKILPTFVKGESGPHVPSLVEKQTQPPKFYSEATLLRAMETAGKQVDDDELRELMKANGIGRPSTRAAIIETLFKRQYIQRQKKLIMVTEMGIQLIDTIQNELLKSAELTGQWEKQLKEIEAGTYNAAKFIHDMKQMVASLVEEVKSVQNVARFTATTPAQNTAFAKNSKQPGQKIAEPRENPNKNATTENAAQKTTKKATSKTTKKDTKPAETKCPKCQQGKPLKGKSNYGCSRWNEGCDFRLPFSFMGKEIPEKQLLRLLEQGSTIKIKGFEKDGKKTEGFLTFDAQFGLSLNTEPEKIVTTVPDPLPCPKCHQGTILKGQTAYGCSRWKEGCDFRYSYDTIREKAGGKTLTKELVWEMLKGWDRK